MEEEKKFFNPQRCVLCDGQDGVLERDEESFVHPYCKAVLDQIEE